MNIAPPTLQLASQSPRRRELLSQIGVSFTSVQIAVEECVQVGESPEHYVARLAREKALAGVEKSPGLPTLGADTVVVCDGELLEKPRDFAAFQHMMALLSANTHAVLTAMCVVDGDRLWHDLSITEVEFLPLSAAQITAYWASGEPQDKAGGYAIQGFGAVFVKSLKGSYSGVVGLAIEKLVPILAAVPIPYWVDEKR